MDLEVVGILQDFLDMFLQEEVEDRLVVDIHPLLRVVEEAGILHMSLEVEVEEDMADQAVRFRIDQDTL